MTAGQVHESTQAESVIGQAVACRIGRRRKRKGKRWKPKKLAGDKAYRVPRVRDWLKEYRRIGTRFEKLAVHFHGMLQLAMIKRYLKLLFSDRA